METASPIPLSQADQKRLTKLAVAAGKSPQSMLKHVLRDGFLEVERYVAAVTQGREAAAAGRTVEHETAMKQLRDSIARRAKKAA